MKKLMFKKIQLLVFALAILGLSSTVCNAQSAAKFKSEDIGNPEIKGSAQFVKDGVDITAGGTDIWTTADQFQFVYQEVKGDFDMAVRLASLDRSHLYTKGGLMVREQLTPGSRNLMFVLFPGNDKRNNNRGGYEFQYRLETDKVSKAIYPSVTDTTAQKAFPVVYPDGWMRLKRVGNSFTAFSGTDGKTWKLYTEYTLEMPAKIFFGMAATAHTKGATTVAKFRDLKKVK
jgi:regulation of enolase protein 1 (concanavalin A-like superfamily)